VVKVGLRRWRNAKPKAPRSSAVGARTKTPKASRGVGCGEGVSPPHWVWGGGCATESGGLCPLPRIFFRFGAQNGEFWYILGGILKNAANSVSMAMAC